MPPPVPKDLPILLLSQPSFTQYNVLSLPFNTIILSSLPTLGPYCVQPMHSLSQTRLHIRLFIEVEMLVI